MLEQAVIVDDTGVGQFQVEVHAQGASFFSDESLSAGGLASGPSPYDLLGAALGSCTAMTLRMYARHKGINMEHVQVKVIHRRDPDTRRDPFERTIYIK